MKARDYAYDGLTELGNAVVENAVKDYKHACRVLKRHSPLSDKGFEASKTKAECEWFFNSQYFHVFSSCDGVAILQRLRKDYE